MEDLQIRQYLLQMDVLKAAYQFTYCIVNGQQKSGVSMSSDSKKMYERSEQFITPPHSVFQYFHNIHVPYTTHHLQDLKCREDKTHKAIMIMEANADVLTSLRDFHKRLMENKHVEFDQTCQDNIATFVSQADDAKHDLKLQIVRAKNLVGVTRDREGLVRFAAHFTIFGAKFDAGPTASSWLVN